MMNYEDLVKTIVGGFEDEIRSLIYLGVTEIRNVNEIALSSGVIRIDDIMNISVFFRDVKLEIDNERQHISVFNSLSREHNNIFDTIMVLNSFAVLMTTLKMKGFNVSRRKFSSVINLRIPKEIDDSIRTVFNAMMREAELDIDEAEK